MRPARPASSPVLRGRRVSPDTLMLRQPETAGPAGPLALQKRDTFRMAPVFPVFLLGLFLAFRETVYGEHWTSIVPCCSFSEWGGADPRSRRGGTAEGAPPALGSPAVCATPGARSPSDATGSGHAACRAPESPSPCP